MPSSTQQKLRMFTFFSFFFFLACHMLPSDDLAEYLVNIFLNLFKTQRETPQPLHFVS